VYRKAALVYDAIYASMGKDYGEEADRLRELIHEHKNSAGRRLLDVACGTGSHLIHLQKHYEVQGLDLSRSMLRLARQKLPGALFVKGSMSRFRLDRRFDVILCLFSAIGYARTYGRLVRTFRNFHRHLEDGGIAVVEAWISPEDFLSGSLHGTFVDQKDLKAARITVSRKKHGLSINRFHYLVGTAEGIRHFTDTHRLGLFLKEEYRNAMVKAGFEWRFEPRGLAGRGLHIGIKARPEPQSTAENGLQER
jgi:SAM-dependent methyltransferase